MVGSGYLSAAQRASAVNVMTDVCLEAKDEYGVLETRPLTETSVTQSCSSATEICLTSLRLSSGDALTRMVGSGYLSAAQRASAVNVMTDVCLEANLKCHQSLTNDMIRPRLLILCLQAHIGHHINS
jgi:hypothetical protein